MSAVIPLAAIRRRSSPISRAGERAVTALLMAYAFLLSYEFLFVDLFSNRTVFKPYRIIGLAIIVSWPFYRQGRRFRLDYFGKGLLFLIALGLALAAAWKVFEGSGDVGRAINGTSLSLFAFLTYVALKDSIGTAARLQYVLYAFAVGALTSVAAHPFLATGAPDARLTAFFKNPNGLALAAAVSALVGLAALLFSGRTSRARTLLAAVGVLSSLGILVLTGSKTGVAGVAVSFVFLLGMAYAKSRSSAAVVAKVVALALAASISTFAFTALVPNDALPQGAVGRYDTQAYVTARGRSDVWRSAMGVATDHYLLGVGTHQYISYHLAQVAQMAHLDDARAGKRELGVHNEYVAQLVERGLLGLLIYLSILTVALLRAYKRVQRQAAPAPPVAIAPALLLLLVVAGLGGDLMINPAFYFIAAVATATTRTNSRPMPRQAEDGRLVQARVVTT